MSERESGFTLIEVLIALAILAVSLAAAFEIISTGLDRERDNRNAMIATSLLHSLLDRVDTEIPLRDGEESGVFSNGFRWQLAMHRYGSIDDQKSWKVAAYTVRATILWTDHGEKRSRSLSTLLLQP